MSVSRIGLGGNQGQPLPLFKQALSMLAQRGYRISAVSRAVRSTPWPAGSVGPSYWNAAATLEHADSVTPQALLDDLLAVETSLGRRRIPGERNRPRPIDIDLLLCGGVVVDRVDCTVPHPAMHERPFVLVPLAEIAPDARHPVLGVTIAQLATAVQMNHGPGSIIPDSAVPFF